MGQQADTFRVYRQPRGALDTFSFQGRDESRGILGTLAPLEPPFCAAADLPSAEALAMARLGAEPGDFLYITDRDHRVLRILINDKHHAAVKRASERGLFGYALLVLCFTCLVATANARLGLWPVLLFVGISLIYWATVRLQLFNKVEGAVVCEIILILALALLNVLARMAAP